MLCDDLEVWNRGVGWEGGFRVRGCMCTYADSCFCTALESNYTPILDIVRADLQHWVGGRKEGEGGLYE